MPLALSPTLPHRRLIEGLDAAVWLFAVPRRLRRDRQRAAGRDLLCTVLSVVSGRPSEDWQFATDRFGRPRIVAPASEGLQFSVSYGDGAVAVAVARHCDVGVDIEPLVAVRLAEIPWSELCPDERARLRQAHADERYECFARMWTLKEAFAKCTGRGASLVFSTVETVLEPPGIAGITAPLHREDVEIEGRRHSLAVCTSVLDVRVPDA